MAGTRYILRNVFIVPGSELVLPAGAIAVTIDDAVSWRPALSVSWLEPADRRDDHDDRRD